MRPVILAVALWLASVAPAFADAKADIQAGRAAFERGDHLAAIARIGSAISSGQLAGKELAEAYVLRGRIYMRSGDHERALKDMDEAVRRAPDHADVYVARCEANLKLRKPAEAVSDATVALFRDDKLIDAYACRGTIFLLTGQFSQALQDLDKAIAGGSTDSEVHHNRGLVRLLTGRNDEALADFDRAIDLGKNRPAQERAEMLVSRGRTWNAKGDYDKAIADIDRALALDIRSAARRGDWLAGRARINFERGRYSESIDDLDKAVALDGLTPALRSRWRADRGRAYAALGQIDRAIEEFGAAIAVTDGVSPPQQAERLVLRARAYVAKGEAARAVTDLDKAVAVSPMQASILVERGDLHRREGRADKAMADFRKAMELDPANVLAQTRLVWLVAERSGPAKAVDEAGKLVEIAPESADSFATRGVIRFLAGQFESASKDYDKALSLDPANPYRLMMRYLSAARAGVKGTEALSAGAAKVDRSAWPGPVIDALLGRAAPDAVLAAAAQGDPAGRSGRECEAHYYLGEIALLKGDKATARSHFEKAVATGARDYVEYDAAKAELARLK